MSEARRGRLDNAIKVLTAKEVKKAAGVGHNKDLQDPNYRSAAIECLELMKKQEELREALNLIITQQKDRGYTATSTRKMLQYLSKDADVAIKELQDYHASLIAAGAQLPLFAIEMGDRIMEGHQADVKEMEAVAGEGTVKKKAPAAKKPTKRSNPAVVAAKAVG